MFPLVWCIVIILKLYYVELVFSQTLYNSTLACTRGAEQTYFAIDCKDIYQDGANRVLSFSRVFFGATPNTSGCNRTASYANCCARDTNRPDCTFPVDAELQVIVDKCSGTSYCSFPGKRISTSLGNCDHNLYPDMTSFSFVEYTCTGQTPAASATFVTTTTRSSTVPASTMPGVDITPTDGATFNSSLACTRGAGQTNHDLDCRDHYRDGGNRSLSIVRVFYGTTPLSSGCNRTATYANCCVRDPNKSDCVFQKDVELQDIIEKCSGVSYCEFPGLRVSSSLGNCDPNNYPSLTSFSFIEYQCLPRQISEQTGSTAATAISVTTPNGTSISEDENVNSREGGVRRFETGSIIGIVFGVLGVVILIFIIILIVGRYNKKCRDSSSDSDIAIMPDGTLGKPKSRLWVKDKWSASL